MQFMNIDVVDLIGPIVGSANAARATRMIDLPQIAADVDSVPRALIALGLSVMLFSDLLDRVPSGAAYVDDVTKSGKKVVFDHGALRTIRMPVGYSSGFPDGHEAFARILEPLGYRIAETYPLPALRMTGYAYCHLDLPILIPQFFVSELHVEQFDPAFRAAANNVFDDTIDPVDASTQSLLDAVNADGALRLDQASCLIADLRFCFGRHHGLVSLSDYETLRQCSAEAAWIATEGNAFNHVTDRVPDVDRLAECQRLLGRPIKDTVEVSSTGRVRQTAFIADPVEREFKTREGQIITRNVPGSFYEFITRDHDPASGLLDLSFDSSNAQGIFAMTAAA
jgi:hypothetical protein